MWSRSSKFCDGLATQEAGRPPKRALPGLDDGDDAAEAVESHNEQYTAAFTAAKDLVRKDSKRRRQQEYRARQAQTEQT